MRSFSKFVFAALLIAIAAPALAQETGTSSIAVQQPWARATPAGATTGAVYMTLNNKTGSADRLIGASSDAADKLQIHEMKVVNGVMQIRQLDSCLPIPAGASVVLEPNSYHVMLIGLETACAGRNISADADFPKGRKYFRHGSGTRHWRDAG
jgi:periplasmic copper chaperone A